MAALADRQSAALELVQEVVDVTIPSRTPDPPKDAPPRQTTDDHLEATSTGTALRGVRAAVVPRVVIFNTPARLGRF